MAGIENNIVYGEGFKLQPSSARSISDMQRSPDDVSFVNFTGDPEGMVSANPASLSHDPVSGVVYRKATGVGNTGWTPIGGGGGGITTINGDTGTSTGPTVAFNGDPITGFSFDIAADIAVLNNPNLKFDAAQAYTFVGPSAGNGATSGNLNTGIGSGALNALTSGSNNVSVGSNALTTAEDGGDNTAIGFSALNVLISGNANTAVGSGALQSSLASGNVGIGFSAGSSILTGTDNIIIGMSAGSGYTSSESQNITIGAAGVAGESNVTRIGEEGTQTMAFMAGINGNTVSNQAFVTIDSTNGQLGTAAGGGITSIGGDTGTPNTGPTVDFHGGIATTNPNGLTFDSDGAGNVTLNFPFLRLPSTTPGGDGVIYMEDNSDDYPFMHAGGGGLTSGSTYLGGQAGNLATMASGNTGLGWLSLHLIDTGTGNTAVGLGSAQSIDAGQDNTAVGGACLQLNTSGDNNTAVGASALSNVDTGDNNLGLGFLSGGGISSGTDNLALGNSSLSNSNGNFNTCIGHASGNALIGTDSDNTLINSPGVNGDNNVLRIGQDGTGDGQVNAAFIAGITGRTVTGTAVLCSATGQLGTIASSIKYKENVKDINKDVSILKLRPVEFNYTKEKSESQEKQYGLIAEEVHKDFPYLCFYKDGEPESVKYHEIPVLLLNEIKKLKLEIEELKKSIGKV